MKKTLLLLLLACCSLFGYAQAFIDPLLTEEMGRRTEDEKIKVVVIMKSHYDRTEMNRRADYFVNRAERREFVVNELKEFAAASQYDLRHSLTEMQRNGLTTEPTVLWMANALCFEANRAAIVGLAQRTDIAMIGYAIERNWIPDGEVATPAPATREITQNITQVHADQVWALGYTGQGVVVAVIDTGVNYNHVDLADHLWDGGSEFPHHGYDVKNGDNDPYDDQGHGSHCAGTVCGDGSGASQTGMAPDATLMCVKCLDSSGNGGAESISAGIQWAVEHGCDMFSMSLGIATSTVPERTLLRHTCEAALDAGVVAAIAAGNEGNSQWQAPIPNNVRVPGSCPPPYMDEVQAENPGGHTCSVCIGAVDYSDAAAYFTSRGPVTWTNTEFGDYPYEPGIGLIRPDVCAPGVDIKSINYQSNTGYTLMSGTSMATPCAAGCIALMLSKDINLSPSDVCRILEETALPLAEGKSNTFGFGRIDVLQAVEAIQLGAIKYNTYEINDALGNNNHNLNPGESVMMNLTLDNITDAAVSNVSVVLTTADEHVTITQNTAQFPNFAANQTLTVADAFAFSVDDEVVANDRVKFTISISVDGEPTSSFNFSVFVYDYKLQLGATAVLNDENNNGLLNPGETADLRIFIDNVGNELVQGLTGVLSTDYEWATLNSTEAEFGTVGAEMMGYADYNLTLDAAAPEDFVIPFTLNLVDAYGRQTVLTFSYRNACDIIFSLVDSYGDGWQGNYLTVSYSDGTPTEQMTVESGSTATYTRQVASGSMIMLAWHNGQWTSECSFQITYADGTVIFENSGGFSGSRTLDINCGGGGSVPTFCEPVRNLTYDLVDHDVVLTWEAPVTALPAWYEVYRETELLDIVEELTFTDPNMEDGLYNYCVYAAYDGCQSEFVCTEVELSSCGAVKNLDYALDEELMLTLTWEAPEDPTGLIEYQVYRDGDMIASTNELTYTFMMEAGTYDVAVKAVYDGCDKDAYVQVCIIGSINNMSYLYLEGHEVMVSWTPIEGYGEYEVYINDVLAATVEGDSYTVALEPGLSVVTVKPYAEGCYAVGLSLEVCLIDAVENLQFVSMDDDGMLQFTWDAVESADYYSITANGETTQVTETIIAFKGEIGLNDICVVAHSVYGCESQPTCLTDITVCPPVDGFDYFFIGNLVSISWQGEGIIQNEVVLDGVSQIVEENRLVVELGNGPHSITVTPSYETECWATYSASFEFEVTNTAPEIRFTDVRDGLMATAWTSVDGAMGYNLYRDGEGIAFGITQTEYNDTEMEPNMQHCYAVQSVFEKGTSDLSEAACANYFTGIGENDGSVSIFPNPTSDKLNIQSSGMNQIDIYSIDGKLVRSLKVEDDTVQIDGLESGIYMLRIIKGDEVIVRKVVKQ